MDVNFNSILTLEDGLTVTGEFPVVISNFNVIGIFDADPDVLIVKFERVTF
jgi:hypothetical protein